MLRLTDETGVLLLLWAGAGTAKQTKHASTTIALAFLSLTLFSLESGEFPEIFPRNSGMPGLPALLKKLFPSLAKYRAGVSWRARRRVMHRAAVVNVELA